MSTERARELRKASTEAERLLWKHLRNRQLGGYKFRRQYPIGPYIVDFVCYEKRLVVEVDGGQHGSQREYDDERTRWLEAQEYTVMRFWNSKILRNLDTVKQAILEELEGR